MANEFEQIIKKSVNYFKTGWYYKIDTPFRAGGRQSKSPFDSMWLHLYADKDSEISPFMIAMEMKSGKTKLDGYYFEVVKDHQIKGLLDFKKKTGGRAYILFHFKSGKYHYGYAIDIHAFIKIRDIGSRIQSERVRVREMKEDLKDKRRILREKRKAKESITDEEKKEIEDMKADIERITITKEDAKSLGISINGSRLLRQFFTGPSPLIEKYGLDVRALPKLAHKPNLLNVTRLISEDPNYDELASEQDYLVLRAF